MKKKIVILGLEPGSGNFGCAALAYSFINILRQIAEKNELSLIIYAVCSSPYNSDWPNIEIYCKKIELKRVSFYIGLQKIYRTSNIIVDFSEGDSFTDIYGMHRFLTRSLLKELAIKSGTTFLMGPQTYGPFHKKWSRVLAAQILKKCKKVYARDKQSASYIKQLTGICAETVIDVAFALPYGKSTALDSDKIKIGINISGLLWNEGYTGKNEFGLTVDYKKYCKMIIRELLDTEDYEIHLIPHVISNDLREDDMAACKEINRIFRKTILAPQFTTPVQAKTYIAQMDIFSGARMHATIGAFSSGVATIPFSYSRKFEGLYETLKYDYCIHGQQYSTEEAVEKTLKYVQEYQTLQNQVKEGNKISSAYLQRFSQDIERVLLEN